MGILKKLLIIILLLSVITVAGLAFYGYGEISLACKHQLTEVAEVPATCAATGLAAHYQCSECGKLFADAKGENEIEAPDVIEALAHTEAIYDGVDATCTEDGVTEGKYCSVCGEVLVSQEVAPAKGHADDNNDHNCDACGVAVSECVDADTNYVCDICGAALEAPCTHANTVAIGEAKDATCTVDGITAGAMCADCNEVIEAQQAIAAFGHSYDVKEGADGFYKECASCGDVVACDAPVADSYKATFNNEFSSVKENVLTLVYSNVGAWGVLTSGSHKVEVDAGSPASGGIGGLDKAGSYVYYEFVMEAAGTVDIIWNIAGSNWDGSGNAGIADMAAHMTLTIDGKPVDISGLALSADGEYPWWNLQNLVIENVVLDAGVHTIKCDVNAAGGLNVGSMTIQSSKDVNVKKAEVQTADVVVEGDKIYYVLTFANNGFAQEEIKFFNEVDGEFVYYEFASFETVDGVVTVKIDISDMDLDSPILAPHMSFGDHKYVNDSNKNGDVRGPQLQYEEKAVGFGGVYYMLYNYYEMPSVKVATNALSISNVDLIEKDGSVYYTLTYYMIGYNPETFRFFDGNTTYAVEYYETEGFYVTFYVNVTDYDSGTTLWPHLEIDGQKWNGTNNTASSNGDINFSPAGKTITLNGRTYELKTQWSMPTVIFG